jgi:modulator of FtsH protease
MDRMNEPIQTFGYGYAGASVAERNRVLRNTYWLLALSLVPTVLGAWLGVATGITRGLMGGMGMLVFFGGAFAFMFAIEKTKNSSTGVAVLLGFTFFMGLMLSRLLSLTLSVYTNGPALIMTAFGGTAAVFFAMATLSTVIKRDLSWLGKFLFVGAVMVMIGSVILAFVPSLAGVMVLCVAVIGIFSAYMLYDVKQIIDGGETNYITATLNLYLDAFNVFQALLSLLGIFGGRRD